MVKESIAKSVKKKIFYLLFREYQLKKEPMIGVIDTTCADKATFKWMMRKWSWNIDSKRICKGSKVFLQVF